MRARLILVGVAAVAVIGACADGAGRSEDTASTETSTRITTVEVAAAELVRGDCVSGLVIGKEERTLIDSVRVVDCGSRHDLEVFATFELTAEDFDTDDAGVYPGEQGVVRAADHGCRAKMEQLGVEDQFGLIAIWPTDTSWMQGDRAVKCAAFSRDGRPFDGRVLLAGEEP